MCLYRVRTYILSCAVVQHPFHDGPMFCRDLSSHVPKERLYDTVDVVSQLSGEELGAELPYKPHPLPIHSYSCWVCRTLMAATPRTRPNVAALFWSCSTLRKYLVSACSCGGGLTMTHCVTGMSWHCHRMIFGWTDNTTLCVWIRLPHVFAHCVSHYVQ